MVFSASLYRLEKSSSVIASRLDLTQHVVHAGIIIFLQSLQKCCDCCLRIGRRDDRYLCGGQRLGGSGSCKNSWERPVSIRAACREKNQYQNIVYPRRAFICFLFNTIPHPSPLPREDLLRDDGSVIRRAGSRSKQDIHNSINFDKPLAHPLHALREHPMCARRAPHGTWAIP